MKRTLIGAGIIVMVAIIGIVALSIPRGTSKSDSRPAAEVGHPAPAFTLTDLNGRTVSVRSFRGKVTLLNFWATWCHPCRSEMPRLASWDRTLRARGFTVLGIDKQEPRSDVMSFTRSLHIPYPVVLDESGSVATTYHASALPVSYLLDRQGVIRAITFGAVDQQFLKSQIEPILKT